LKVETTFAIFEKSVINKTIEKNSWFAYKVAKAENNTEVKLYTNIEWNLNRLGDKLSNNIKYTINFLTEQIAIMFVSWLMWNVALRWLNATKFATLWANWSKLWKIASFTWKAWWEWTWFYGTYTLLNWVVNEKELNDIFKNYNGYDWLKTIAFLWILRSLPLEKLRNKYNIENSKFLNEIKNITIDTAAVLWTDITIKWFESLGNNILWNKNWNENINRSYWEYLVEELSYIVPLVIWLRQADKAVARMFEWWKKPETTVNIKWNDLIIMFKIGELRTEIRVLKEYRNILRNKWKSTKEINKKITEKKKEKKEEYKKVRDNNQVEQEQLEQPKQTNQEKNKPIQPKKSEKNNVDKAKENVNTDSWTKEMTWKIIQNVLKWNIEDVMKGFWRNGSISEEFQKLLKSGNKEQVRELVWKEVDLEVQKLKSEWVKIDESWKKFIEEFKEQRVAEFEKIVEIKREQKDIPSEIKMSFKWKEWDLKLKDLEGLNKWFEQWIKRNNLIQEDENNRIKNKKT
jgi:hypothetical protein